MQDELTESRTKHVVTQRKFLSSILSLSHSQTRGNSNISDDIQNLDSVNAVLRQLVKL